MKRSFPIYQQLNAMDCGPTCLRMIAKWYGRHFNLEGLRQASGFNKDGVNLLGISEAAEKIGFRTRGVKISLQQLLDDAAKPCILHWGQNHFVVLPPQKNTNRSIHIADPARGLLKLDRQEFEQQWLSTMEGGEATGIVLLLEPTPAFFEQESEKQKGLSWGFLFGYVKQQKRFFIQLCIGLLIGSLMQLIFPFLTQSVVDTGINTHNLQFIYLVLIAQFMLSFSRSIVEFIRSRILLHVSIRINISILSDFWIKLMQLPLSYFDTKQTGDILQRIGDHSRIQNFLTGSALNVIFSVFNLIIFSIVLLTYNSQIFFIFLAGSILYFGWIKLFMRYRRKLDYKHFALGSKENTATMQLIYGMQDIKLNGAEHLRRWEWEGLQAALFRLSFKSLSISQYQQAGAFFINEGKNILITFFVAKSVFDGQLTLGAMLAVQYIIGQLNGPIEGLIGFAQQAQDARISLERLNEIHAMEDEEPSNKQLLQHLPSSSTITINNLSYTYPGAGNEPVLKNINLIIPEGKVTAIVGVSGSGKTTLLKLLLRFYENYKGEMIIGKNAPHDEKISASLFNRSSNNEESGTGSIRLSHISPKFWRSRCGSVLQDGYIFSDSIAVNIAMGDETPDYPKLIEACRMANILSFIESLPLGFDTKIGAEGNGISMGQKQRIFIARAIYKNPDYIFFDEATNSLDANNEKAILENMTEFFAGRTAVVVAHRLSTVKNADNIVVLHNGTIVEEGTHLQLSQQKGYYYELVKNQLELGN